MNFIPQMIQFIDEDIIAISANRGDTESVKREENCVLRKRIH